jgi:hypothetical protein
MKYYVITACSVIIFSYIVNKWKSTIDVIDQRKDEILIQKYLLNDTPLYGHNRPKLWIHIDTEVNARKWKNFYSRNTTDLNEPYVHLTIKTIINHCSNDFNICLIDDETFSKLLPSWDINLSLLAEPLKNHFRKIAMLNLLYNYGGMILPSSFICLKNMKEFYENAISENVPFVCEAINRSTNLLKQKNKMLFIPDTYIMGSNKNDEVIFELIQYLKSKNRDLHFTNEREFLGDTSEWCIQAIKNDKMVLVSGELIGIKTKKEKKTILIEDLMEEEYLDIHEDAVGIYIPNDEILKRPKYQWFAVLPSEQLLKSNIIVAKYLISSIVDTTDEYKKSTEIKSIMAI